MQRWAWIIVALLFMVRLHLLNARLFDPDEFEHLHAAYCLAHGAVPYRDFFEHHGPATYASFAPFVGLLGETPGLLVWQRVLSLVFLIALAPAVYLLAGRNPCGLVWLLTFPPAVEKSIEWRPDVPASCFLAWGTWLLLSFLEGKQAGRSVRPFGAGLCVGLATLFTQKAVFLGLGLACVGLVRSPQLRGRLGLILHFGLGFLSLWGTAGLVFWILHAGESFYNCLFVYPAIWPRQSRVVVWPWGATHFSAPHLIILLAALIASVRAKPRMDEPMQAKRLDGRALSLAGILLVHWLAIPVLPAVYLQYFWLGWPIAGALVGLTVADGLPARRNGYGHIGACLFLSVVVFGIHRGDYVLRALADAWNAQSLAPIQNLPLASLYPAIDLIAMVSAALGLFAYMVTAGIPRKVAGVVVAIGLGLPVCNRLALPHFFWPKDRQMEQMSLVLTHVAANETVLDGFSGLGALRPHACYWWWINEHSLPLIRKLGRTREIAATFATDRRPAAILVDSSLLTLLRNGDLPELSRELERGYEPLGDAKTLPVVFQRKGVRRDSGAEVPSPRK